MLKINNAKENNFTYIDKNKIIFKSKNNDYYISNNLDVNVDEIIIYNNVGIFLMLKNSIVKSINARYINIELYDEDVIKIHYSDEIENKRLKYPSTLMIYYNKIEHKEKLVDSSFIPQCISYNGISITVYIFMYIKKLFDDGVSKEKIKNKTIEMMNDLSYEIKDADSSINDLYLVSAKNVKIYKDIGFDLEEEYIEVYTLLKDVLTLNDLLDFINDLK